MAKQEKKQGGYCVELKTASIPELAKRKREECAAADAAITVAHDEEQAARRADTKKAKDALAKQAAADAKDKKAAQAAEAGKVAAKE